MTRHDLITSREFWVEVISNNLWRYFGCIEEDSEKHDVVAENIVDECFMKTILELQK